MHRSHLLLPVFADCASARQAGGVVLTESLVQFVYGHSTLCWCCSARSAKRCRYEALRLTNVSICDSNDAELRGWKCVALSPPSMPAVISRSNVSATRVRALENGSVTRYAGCSRPRCSRWPLFNRRVPEQCLRPQVYQSCTDIYCIIPFTCPSFHVASWCMTLSLWRTWHRLWHWLPLLWIFLCSPSVSWLCRSSWTWWDWQSYEASAGFTLHRKSEAICWSVLIGAISVQV